jgi:3D (Asp-Asp-Asp) domain-containing protein
MATFVRIVLAVALIPACSGEMGGVDGSGADGDARADADADADGEVAPDADHDEDSGWPPDGDLDADALDADEDDGDTAGCTDPPGAACNPIVIDRFPFSHDGDTSEALEELIDVYSCAPDVDERGPEVHYELVLSGPGVVGMSVDEAPGVDVDLHVLRDADPGDCIVRANTELERGLARGVYRLVVDTYYDGDDLSGPYTLRVTFEDPPPAERLGAMWNTYYFLASEADHDGPQDVPIYTEGCEEIARVREGFHDSVCIEGSGILLDGRVINYASTCTDSCPSARRCGSHDYRVCYGVLDRERYPWGAGAAGVALIPDFSIAVDPGFVALGTVIYFEELDGVVPPGGSMPHDGCMRADDTGGAIDGNHFDFFAGTRDRWLAWEDVFPTRSEFTAWINHERCFGR